MHFNPSAFSSPRELDSPTSTEHSLDITEEEQDTLQQFGAVRHEDNGLHPRDWTIGSTITYRKTLHDLDPGMDEITQGTTANVNEGTKHLENTSKQTTTKNTKKHHLKDNREQGGGKRRMLAGKFEFCRTSETQRTEFCTLRTNGQRTDPNNCN